MKDFNHFIIIRFSTILKSRPEFKKNIPILFTDERLKLRFELFENFCLKGIINQTVITFKVIIIYDPKLPEYWKNKLIELIKPYKYIILHKWNINDILSSNMWLNQYISIKKKYLITTRLDDDDIINKNINKYVIEFILKFHKKKYKLDDRLITFKNSWYIDYENNKYKIYPTKLNALACYMTYITCQDKNSETKDLNIYSLMHDNLNRNYKVLNLINSFGVLNHQMENNNRLIRFKNKIIKKKYNMTKF